MAKPEENDAPEISEEDKKRIQKATTLLAAYTNFMRWAGNFRRDEIKRHPRHGSVVMLSPLQSSRMVSLGALTAGCAASCPPSDTGAASWADPPNCR